MLENRNSQQSCKVYLTKATSYFIRFMYVPVLGKTSSFLVFIFFETPRKTFFRSISIKELSKIYIHKNNNFFYPFRRSYLIKLVIFKVIWYFYRIKQIYFWIMKITYWFRILSCQIKHDWKRWWLEGKINQKKGGTDIQKRKLRRIKTDTMFTFILQISKNLYRQYIFQDQVQYKQKYTILTS